MFSNIAVTPRSMWAGISGEYVLKAEKILGLSSVPANIETLLLLTKTQS